jgi:enoyl-CoA hydratase/carnithine racemase
MNRQLSRELHDAVKRMDADEAIGRIAISGARERAFSAGGDIHEQREADRRYTQEELDAHRPPRRSSYEIAAYHNMKDGTNQPQGSGSRSGWRENPDFNRMQHAFWLYL